MPGVGATAELCGKLMDAQHNSSSTDRILKGSPSHLPTVLSSSPSERPERDKANTSNKVDQDHSAYTLDWYTEIEPGADAVNLEPHQSSKTRRANVDDSAMLRPATPTEFASSGRDGPMATLIRQHRKLLVRV
ncbi:hypothetical protein BDU57DRAFT_531268 [Ampelomyces quisqualis]|uniref:Uncharacterized protein n=1 Tax=Ampelomyces quisqualis TaxID=50730 RepID=A0A6A5QJ28_AMPQU|nr:hypothetical protein BDU57DRAFT_531268 [Ampelomyces quisqualis]